MFTTATIIAGLGVAASVAGTAIAYKGQQDAAAAQKKASDLKGLQMNLDTARQTRDIARKAMMARSQALVNATSQGAAQGSGLAGGQAQITGQEGAGQLALSQNSQLGTQMFAVNQQITDGQTMASTGMGMNQFGSQIYQNSEMLGRVGSYFTGKNTWG